MATEGAIVYDRAGNGGQAKSTLSGLASGLRNFAEFITTKRIPKSNGGFSTKLSELSSVDICKVELWQEYGTSPYISRRPNKSNKYVIPVGDFLINNSFDAKGDSTAARTALQYLSACKRKAKELFPDEVMFKAGEDKEKWMRNIRADVEKRINKRIISTGQSIENRA